MQKRSTVNKGLPRIRIRILIVPFLLLALTVLHHLYGKYSENKDANITRQSYEVLREQISPHVQHSLHVSAVNSNNTQVIHELRKRAAYTFPVKRLLETLRENLPDTVQFNSFSFLTIPILSTSENPSTFRQDWPVSFSVDGLIQSEYPEKDMLSYLDTLRNGFFIGNWFTILQMTRFSPIDEKNDVVQFRIEGEGVLSEQNRVYQYVFLNGNYE